MGFNIGPTISVKGEAEYISAMKNIKANMKLIASEANVMTANFKGNESSVQALTAKGKVLNEALKTQKAAVKEAEDALQRMKKSGVDPSSQAYTAMQTNLNNAKAAMISTTKEIKDNESAMKSGGKETGNFSQHLKDFAHAAGTVALGAAKAFAVGIGAIATAVTAVAIAGLKVAFNYNKEMESFTSDFKVMLGSQEEAVTKVNELKAMAASTPFEMSDLAAGTKTMLAFGATSANSLKYIQMTGDISLGNAEKFQRLNNAFGKSLSLGKLTGETYQQMVEAGFNPLAVISEKTGETMEQLQKRMSKGKISAEELAGAMDTATSEGGKFYKGMEEASKTTDGLISTLKDNARAFVGDVMKPITETIRTEILPAAISYVGRLQEAFNEDGLSGVADEFGKIFSEVAQSVADAIPGIADGIAKGAPILINAVSGIISSLVSTITSVLPTVLPTLGTAAITLMTGLLQTIQQNAAPISEAVVQIIMMFVLFLTDNMPMIVETGMTILLAVSQGILDNIPSLIPAIVEMITGIALAITEPNTLAQLAVASLDIIIAVAQGLLNALPQLLEAALQIVVNLALAFGQAAPQLWDKGKEFIVQMGEGIWAQLSTLFTQIGGWVDTNIVQPVKGKLEEFRNIGKDLITGIWNGINDKVAWLKQQVKGVVDKIKSWFTGKDGFDEHSPSLWGKGVGAYLFEGVGLGAESALPNVLATMGNSIKRIKQTISSGMATALDFTMNAVGSVGMNASASGSAATAAAPAPNYIFQIYAKDKDTAIEVADETVAMLQTARWVTP
ncbi:MAG: hypothetical protein CVV04_12035 [Firmicutes bacterium HGW-Firmicutes-9]|jgi:tape measure domain-containing protein|nr:MAG: hypothetical protein CVV04_12035 [Firmicutes bacterium HGW-Firmicutes-9]